jgi:hypothetical protein
MSGAIFLFVLLAAIGYFIDFIIGEVGRAATGNRLVDWYVALNTKSGWKISLEAADAVDRFLTHLLGGPVGSAKGLIRVLMFSAAFDSALIAAVYSLTLPKWHVCPWSLLHYYWRFLPAIVLSNTVVNALALSLTRLMFAGLRRSRTPWAIAGLTIGEAGIAYLAAATTTLLTMMAALAPHITRGTFIFDAHQAFKAPWHGIGRIYVNLSLFSISAVLPSFLHFATLLVLFAFAISKPLLEGPMTILLERLYGSPKGVFTVLGSMFGILAGILVRLSTFLK